MSDSDPRANNPYQPPREVAADKLSSTRLSKRYAGLAMGVFGATAGSLAEYLIYHADSRLGKHELQQLVIVGGVACGLLWTITGAVTGWQLKRMGLTLAASLVVAGLWVLLGGTHDDVLGAAVCVGWPVGGLGAAILLGAKVFTKDGDL
jgi:hypothetical protein